MKALKLKIVRHALAVRTLGVLLALVQSVTLLYGCSAAEKPSAAEISGSLAAPFTADVTVTCRGNEYGASIQKNGDVFNVTMNSPALFKGMEISFERDSAVVTYNGLTFTLDSSRLPAASAIKALITALGSAAVPDVITVEADGETGEILLHGDGFTVCAVEREDSGGFAVRRVEIPDQELTAIFSEFAPAA